MAIKIFNKNTELTEISSMLLACHPYLLQSIGIVYIDSKIGVVSEKM